MPIDWFSTAALARHGRGVSGSEAREHTVSDFNVIDAMQRDRLIPRNHTPPILRIIFLTFPDHLPITD